MEQRGYDSRVFHGGCRAEMGFPITLLHSVPIYMPLCHLQAAHRGEEESRGEERRAPAMGGGEKMIEEERELR